MRFKPTPKSIPSEFDSVSNAPLGDLVVISTAVILPPTPSEHHYFSESDAELAVASSDVEHSRCILATPLQRSELVDDTGTTAASSVFSLETNPLATNPPPLATNPVAASHKNDGSVPSDTSLSGPSICLTQASFVSSQLFLKELTQKGKKGSVVIEFHGSTFVILTPKAILRDNTTPSQVEAHWPTAYCPIPCVQKARVRVKAYGMNFSEHILAETIVWLPSQQKNETHNLRLPLKTGELNLTFTTTSAERLSKCTSSRSCSSAASSTSSFYSFRTDVSPKALALRAMARNQPVKICGASFAESEPKPSALRADMGCCCSAVSCWNWLRTWHSPKVRPGSNV